MWALSALRAACGQCQPIPCLPPHLPWVAGEVWRAAAFDIGLAAPQLLTQSRCGDGFGETQVLEGSDSQGLPLASISPASGSGSCRAQRCRRSRQLPVKAKHDSVRAKTAAEPGRCPRAAHTQHIPRIHTLHPPLRAAPGLAYACDSHAGYF